MLTFSSLISISYGFVHRVMGNIQQLFSWYSIYIFPFKTYCHHPQLDHLPSHLTLFCFYRVMFLFTQPKMTNNAGESKIKKKKIRQIMKKKKKRQIRQGTREPLAGWLQMISREGRNPSQPEFRIQTRISKHGQELTARTDINDPAGKCTGD